MMALRPGQVDLPRAQRILGHPLRSQLQANPREVIDHIAGANAALGEESLDAAVKTAVAKAQELLAEAGG